MAPRPASWRSMPSYARILVGLVAGASAGVVTNLATGGSGAAEGLLTTVTDPAGRIWLNALIMVVIPLVVSTLAVGVAALGSLHQVGRVGAITAAVFLLLTAVSTLLGLLVVGLVRPGAGLPPDVAARLLDTYRDNAAGAATLATDRFGVDLFVAIVPRNPIEAAARGDLLAMIFVAVIIGVALTRLPDERARPLLGLLDSVVGVTTTIIDLVMRLAPIGVFCLIFGVTARLGFDVLRNLAAYVVAVIAGLLVLQVVVYPIVLKVLARRDPIDFFRRTRVVALTAFSTSSSNATLPTTLRVTEEALGVPPRIARFVIALGATTNMNGTALFEGVTVLFVAQVFGIDLSWTTQLIVLLMAIVTAIGAAGVPGGSIPLLTMVLGMVGAPPEGIALVLGVDRLLDMCRTVANVTGDMVTATVVERFARLRPAGDAGGQP